MLTVTRKNLDDGVVLELQGRIVRGHEIALLCAAIGQQRHLLTLDLAGVDAIDAAGIGLLVSLQAAGIYLRLVNPTKQVREILKVTQLESVFEIRDFQLTEEMITTDAIMVGTAARV